MRDPFLTYGRVEVASMPGVFCLTQPQLDRRAKLGVVKLAVPDQVLLFLCQTTPYPAPCTQIAPYCTPFAITGAVQR